MERTEVLECISGILEKDWPEFFGTTLDNEYDDEDIEKLKNDITDKVIKLNNEMIGEMKLEHLCMLAVHEAMLHDVEENIPVYSPIQ